MAKSSNPPPDDPILRSNTLAAHVFSGLRPTATTVPRRPARWVDPATVRRLLALSDTLRRFDLACSLARVPLYPAYAPYADVVCGCISPIVCGLIGGPSSLDIKLACWCLASFCPLLVVCLRPVRTFQLSQIKDDVSA